MVDHHIVRLDVSVHNAHAVAVIQCAQQLIEITLKGRFSMTTFGKAESEDSLQTSNVVVCESLIELLEVSVIDMLKYQSWGSADRILAN